MSKTEEKTVVTWRKIPNHNNFSFNGVVSPRHHLLNDAVFSFAGDNGTRCKFASVSVDSQGKQSDNEFTPTTTQLLKHPLAVVALVPKDAALFLAGAVAGAAAKTVTAPLDRIKLLMQVRFAFSSLYVLYAALFLKRHCVNEIENSVFSNMLMNDIAFLQTHGVRVGQESAKKTIGLIEVFCLNWCDLCFCFLLNHVSVTYL